MSKDKISDYSATANSNTDIGGINIDEGCAPSGINDAIRTLMKQLKDWQSGSQDVYIHPAGSASVPSITATGDTNTGLFFPAADTVGITTGGTERARVDSSGNLGLGVTPSAQLASYKSFQFGIGGNLIGRSDNSGIELSSNAYRNSVGTYIYLNTDNAASYRQYSGQHQWFNAASGTAGNAITFTQAMTLDASGNLGVGTTSAGTRLVLATDDSATTGQMRFARSADVSYFWEIGRDNNTSGAFIFSNASGGSKTERARIDSSGNLLVGTTTQLGSAKATFKAGSTLPAISIGMANSSGTYAAQIFFDGDNTDSGSIDVNNDANTTAYTTSSDYRLKINIQPISNALYKVSQLNPVTWNWKKNPSLGSSGFIAHELQDVCPDAVTGHKDEVDVDGNPVYQGIDTSFLVATLTAAIQEQQKIITQLQADVAALKGQA